MKFDFQFFDELLLFTDRLLLLLEGVFEGFQAIFRGLSDSACRKQRTIIVIVMSMPLHLMNHLRLFSFGRTVSLRAFD